MLDSNLKLLPQLLDEDESPLFFLDVNLSDLRGNTALLLACKMRRNDVLSLMLRSKDCAIDPLLQPSLQQLSAIDYVLESPAASNALAILHTLNRQKLQVLEQAFVRRQQDFEKQLRSVPDCVLEFSFTQKSRIMPKMDKKLRRSYKLIKNGIRLRVVCEESRENLTFYKGRVFDSEGDDVFSKAATLQASSHSWSLSHHVARSQLQMSRLFLEREFESESLLGFSAQQYQYEVLFLSKQDIAKDLTKFREVKNFQDYLNESRDASLNCPESKHHFLTGETPPPHMNVGGVYQIRRGRGRYEGGRMMRKVELNFKILMQRPRATNIKNTRRAGKRIQR